ncbi:MAG: hypothetical protein JWM82_4039 [Myxococcales bacterium]|jgi:hypothetical protein|nr:hypothetical protein [Myxococcales bacterium]
MLTEEEKTPAIFPAKDAATLRRSPPPGRPPGTLSISELRERITADVSRTMREEYDRRREHLRTELMQEVRAAKSLGIAALLVNVASIAAVVASARGRLGLMAGFAVASIEFLVVSVVWAIARRGRAPSLSLIRLP